MLDTHRVSEPSPPTTPSTLPVRGRQQVYLGLVALFEAQAGRSLGDALELQTASATDRGMPVICLSSGATARPWPYLGLWGGSGPYCWRTRRPLRRRTLA